jgi:hypothetical protein
VPGLLLLPSKKNRLRPAQYNSQYDPQYSTQIAQKRAISEFSTSGVPPVPWVVALASATCHWRLAATGRQSAARCWGSSSGKKGKSVRAPPLAPVHPMTAQKAQADVLLHRLYYALPGWDAAAERRDAQDELHSAAQARAWADGDFDADHGFAFDGAGRARRIRAGRAAPSGWRRRMCARPCLPC